MFKVKTHYNATDFAKAYEQNRSASATIPDQTLSIKEIMERYAKGLPIDGEKVPMYAVGEGDDDGELIPDFSMMSTIDKMEYLEDVRRMVAATRKELADNRAAMEAAAKQKHADQGPKVQRTTGDAVDQGPTDQPDGAQAPPQYPKKTPPEGPRREPRGSKSTNEP